MKIFLSYSHEDKDSLDELRIFLSPLVDNGQVELTSWYDGNLIGGDEWKTVIEKELNSCQIVLLLISPYFLASTQCRREWKTALERHQAGQTRVIPVLLKDSGWKQTRLSDLQCLPNNAIPITDWQSRDKGYLNVFNGLVNYISSEQQIETSPQESRLSIHQRNHNLPRRTTEVIGRLPEMEIIMTALASRFPVVSIEGFQGIGKSTVALEVAYACIGNSHVPFSRVISYECVVWISAKDRLHQVHWLNEVLNAIATVLKYESLLQLTVDDVSKLKTIDTLLSRHKVLIIIDNFESINDQDLINWFDTIPEPSKTLLTSRSHQIRGREIPLKGMKDSEALDLIRQMASENNLEFINKLSDQDLLPLIRETGGNPRAFELAIGLIKGGKLHYRKIIEQLHQQNPDKSIEVVFETLHKGSWDRIGDDAQQIMLALPLFVGVNDMHKEALRHTSGFEFTFEFDEALQHLLDWQLLEVEPESQRYLMHPITRRFTMSELQKRPELEDSFRSRWIDYHLRFVQTRIQREEPSARYWNVLVSDRMREIDDEWPSIHEVVKWLCSRPAPTTEQDELFMQFVLLLVHYMDSRLLNQERLAYVKVAINVSERLNWKYEEALLRIDALGWTHVEERDFDQAMEEIKQGINTARSIIDSTEDAKAAEDAKELIALGSAWQARALIEQSEDKVEEASDMIRSLLGDTLSQECRPWIQARIFMAAGDIYLKQENRSSDAYFFYSQAKERNISYGDEGGGYQINPRLGLAYLALGELEKAENIFSALQGNKQIPIGKLYGEYGLALVKSNRGFEDEAHQQFSQIKKELVRRTNSNLLLKLIEEFENRRIIPVDSFSERVVYNRKSGSG